MSNYEMGRVSAAIGCVGTSMMRALCDATDEREKAMRTLWVAARSGKDTQELLDEYHRLDRRLNKMLFGAVTE